MFINYFKNDSRETPFNLAVVRLLLGSYLIWRFTSFQWGKVAEWPLLLRDRYTLLTVGAESALLLQIQQWILVIFLLLFIIGYRIKISAFVSSLLIAHLSLVINGLNFTGKSTLGFISVHILILYALYSEYDTMSIDGLLRTRNKSLDELVNFIKEDKATPVAMPMLKYSLLLISMIYFTAGVSKLRNGGLEWMTATTLNRHVLSAQIRNDYYRIWADVLLSNPLLSSISAIVTVVLELAFLIVVVVGGSLTLVILGLFGMHIGVALAMYPLFFDMFIMLGLFFFWDTVYAKTVTSREVDLVFDEHCYFCAQSLYLLKLLDINNTVNWLSQYSAPNEYKRRDGIDFEEQMYIFVDGEAYGGYHAFRQLFKQFTVTLPAAWFMALSPVAAVGERAYRYIAENRGQHFVCEYEPTDSS